MTTNLPAIRAKALAELAQKARTRLATTGMGISADIVASSGKPRLIFAMDATYSRSRAWESASQITADMLCETPDNLEVQLVYFQGNTFTSEKFTDNVGKLADAISGVKCEAGYTKLTELASHAVEEAGKGKLRSIIFIGDSFEESLDGMMADLGRLRALGVRIFIFAEGDDREARSNFEQMAKATDGMVFDFDSSAVGKVRDILRGISLLSSGGVQALQAAAKRLPGAALLLAHVSGAKA